MIRPVSDAASNSHPVAALVRCTNIPVFASARAPEGGTILFFGFLSQAKSDERLEFRSNRFASIGTDPASIQKVTLSLTSALNL